jgi:hypothetical protein
MSKYDQLLTGWTSNSNQFSKLQHDLSAQLYWEGEGILSRNEERLTRWNTKIHRTSLSCWLSDPSHSLGLDVSRQVLENYLDTIFVFDGMLVYHAITTHWTVIMSLRLLLSDILTFMSKIDSTNIPVNHRDISREHQIQLMTDARNVLRTICYATDTDSKAVAPFAFTAAFQLTVKVLDREISTSATAVEQHESSLQEYLALRDLATKYLQWASRTKIPVTMV